MVMNGARKAFSPSFLSGIVMVCASACADRDSHVDPFPPVPMYWSEDAAKETDALPSLPPGACTDAEALTAFHADTVQMGELARKPKLIHLPDPVYPESERSQGWEGTLRISVLVRPDGRVARGAIGDGTDPFMRAALDAACGAVFEPGISVSGDSVFVWIEQPVKFNLGLGITSNQSR